MYAKRVTAITLALVLALVTQGCEDTTPSEEQHAAIEKALHGYLGQLAEAYSGLDASVLENHATGGEIASVQRLLNTLATSGDRVESDLLGLEFEDIQVFREVNATVRLMEVWDVGRYDAYTGHEKGRNPGSIQHSLIQLRLMDGRWMVTARRVLETEGQSKWTVPTPAPDETPEPA